jgi:capsular polysaccharide biosynthesis protein
VHEQPLDVRAGIEMIRRRRGLVIGLGVVGLIAGIAYARMHPSMPSASAMVVLPPSASSAAASASSSSGDPNKTQIVFATSSSVLGKAGQSVTPHVGVVAMSKRVKVASVSSDILSIKVSAPRGADAITLANAVAQDYIAYAASLNSASNNTQVQGLNQEVALLNGQEKKLQAQIANLQTQIASEGASTAAGQRDSTLLAALNTELAGDGTTITSYNAQVAAIEANNNAGSAQIIQATSVTSPSFMTQPMHGLYGLIGGLVIGSIIAVSKGRRDRRLRRRDDIAGAIGVSVVASIGAEPTKTTNEWAGLINGYKPDVLDTWSLRRILRDLDVGDPDKHSSVRVISFADDSAALAIGPQISSFSAGLGLSTRLLVGDHPAMGSLRAACAIAAQAQSTDRPLSFTEPQETESDAGTPGSNLTITVVTTDRIRPHLESSDDDFSLLAVSAGFATSEDLARLALAAIDVRQPLDAIVLANPDPSDYTTGDVTRGRGDDTAPLPGKSSAQRSPTQATNPYGE